MYYQQINRFSGKTVLLNRRTFLALASLLFVFWAFPVHADEIVYFEDFEDGVFSGCTSFDSLITTGSAYSGTKRLEEGVGGLSGNCPVDMWSASSSILTYTFYMQSGNGSSGDFIFRSSEINTVFNIQMNSPSPGHISLCKSTTECSGSNAKDLGSFTGWAKVQVVQNGDSIVARLNDTGAWQNIVSGTSVNASHVRLDESSNRYNIDDLSVYSGDSNDTQGQTSACPTCTRIISTDPSMGEYIATTTTGYMVNATYFVANGAQTSSSENDFCSGLSFLRICTTKIQINVKRADSTQVYIYAEEVPDDGEQYIQHFFEEINSAGTYWLEIRIYNEFVGNDLLPSEEILYYISKFYVGTPTSQSALEAFWGTTDINARNELIEEGSIDPGDLTSPGLIPRLFSKTFDDFLHLPPWGYAVVFNDTMQNGTSTALGTLTMSFPTSSVAYGKTLDLSLTDGFSTAIDDININGVTSEYGNQFATFLHYWNLLWYIMFALWIAKEVMGGFTNVDFSRKPDLDSSGQPANSNTIDMGRKTGGWNNVKINRK